VTNESLDPDSSFYRRLAHLDDSGSEDESDDDLNLDELPLPLGSTYADGIPNPMDVQRRIGVARSPEVFAIEAETKEGHERLEWQSMLASVLAGDVLRGESTRQGLNEPTKGGRQKALGQSLWWQIRARMRGRTEAEEKRRVEERRGRIVDSVLEELDEFKIKKSTGLAGGDRRLSSEDAVQGTKEDKQATDLEEVEHEEELSALDQVQYMLEKLSLVEALYPHHTALRQAKPLYDTEKFQSRVNALSAWSTIVQQLQTQLQILQKWTGSDDIDITRPNTTKEKALVAKNRYHPLDAKAKAQSSIDLAADDTTFLERVMKEDNLKRTFEKRIFVDIMSLIVNAKDTVVSWLPAFQELGLPDFQYELVRLIGFPGRLITEALKVRLDAAAKLVDPNSIVINDMIENFRLSISLAVLIKSQYDEIVSPDPEKRWQIPPCMAPDYDTVLLDALRTFFKLLHWKLKSGNRAMYFKETEVLEDEWEFLYEAAEAIEGGDLVVAESFCSLTNKLMVRVANFFETQLGVPIPVAANQAPRKKRELSQRELSELQPDMDAKKTAKRSMTPEEMLVWYGKILEAVKMRYRKLQRFAWYVPNRVSELMIGD
jgi:mitogen-activated protein kinase kinase kinase